MPKKLDLSGKKFNRLTVIKEAGKKQYNILWLCKCDCGNEAIVQGRFIKNGLTKSCGCYKKEMNIKRLTTHGLTNHPLRNVWNSMKQRCFNKNNSEYRNYGARGIMICERWLIFQNFYDDMIGGYFKDAELERINNNGNYMLGNCSWVTHRQQNRNKRNNHIIEFEGKKKSLIEWSEFTGVKANTILTRLRRGWDIHSALLRIPNK